MKSKLLISGKISHEEAKMLAHEFTYSEFEIRKYATKGATISGIHDIVNLIFQDFNSISFLRDYLLGKLIEGIYNSMIGVISRLNQIGKVVNEVTILIDYHKQNGFPVFINISTKQNKFHILIREIMEKLEFDFFERVKNRANVFITLDINDSLQITIT